jgi:hypothetical protein
LSAGHPILDQRPLTLVASGDDLRPWKGRARQFGVLQEHRFVSLGSQPDSAVEMLMPGFSGVETMIH